MRITEKIKFNWSKKMGLYILSFNGEKYKTWNSYNAEQLIELAQYRPRRAWERAKREMVPVKIEKEKEE
jgi:hypothetical protein